MKEDKYAKSLAKNQVCAIFQMRDIWKNRLPKFITLRDTTMAAGCQQKCLFLSFPSNA